MTPDQHNSIKSWSELRDELLQGNAILHDERNALLSGNADLAQEKAHIERDLNRTIGKLEIYTKLEAEKEGVVSKDIADLLIKKAQAEMDLAAITDVIKIKGTEKDAIEASLVALVPVYERVAFQINALIDTVKTVVVVNQENTKAVDILISDLRNVLKDYLPK